MGKHLTAVKTEVPLLEKSTGKLGKVVVMVKQKSDWLLSSVKKIINLILSVLLSILFVWRETFFLEIGKLEDTNREKYSHKENIKVEMPTLVGKTSFRPIFPS